jgi:hypothetical protein
MKALRSFAGICAVTLFMLPAASCVVVKPHDNGKHAGWYKNTNNPHNPAHGASTTVKTTGNGKVKVKTKK